MKITNKNNLPQAMVDAVSDSHKIVDKRYSVTTLLNPIREILLKRRHWDDIEQDVSDMIWLIFGSAVHKIMEESDKTGYSEFDLEQQITDDYVLSGICDLYNEQTFSLEDYKTASVYKVINGDFEDWKKQGLMYAWMLRKSGKFVSNLKFHALLKDYSAKDYRNRGDKFYPEHAVWTWYYEITEDDMLQIEKFIFDKFEQIKKYESVSDDELPICSEEERWNPGDSYRVIKQGAKRALKVTKDRTEALILANENGAVVETIKGEDRKCRDYCLCNKFCKHYKESILNGTIN